MKYLRALLLSFAFFLYMSRVDANEEDETYHEVTPLLSLYTGDALRGAINGGISYTYHLNETYWIGLDFVGGKINVDEPNGMGLTSGEKYLNFMAHPR